VTSLDPPRRPSEGTRRSLAQRCGGGSGGADKSKVNATSLSLLLFATLSTSHITGALASS